MTSQIEITRSTQNTSLYGKGIKEQGIKSMETTHKSKNVAFAIPSFLKVLRKFRDRIIQFLI